MTGCALFAACGVLDNRTIIRMRIGINSSFGTLARRVDVSLREGNLMRHASFVAPHASSLRRTRTESPSTRTLL